jgi:hypothetical protein
MTDTPKPPPDAERPPAQSPNPIPADKDQPPEKISNVLLPA